MFRAYKYRLYPNREQEMLLSKHFGHCRFLWNLALETKTLAYQGNKFIYSRYDLQKQLVDLKHEYDWLKEVNSQSLQHVLLRLNTSFKNFYKGAGFPKFKTKNDKQSFHVPQKVKIKEDRLYVPKFRKLGIKINIHRTLTGDIRSATISKSRSGKYFVSILCDTGISNPEKPNVNNETTVGVDLGIKDFVITSKGDSISNPKFLKNSIDRLKVLQKRASSKKKGSNNRKKAFKKVAVLHEKIKNQRTDFLHKESIRLISENQTICLEDLNVKGMVKNRNLAQAISDVGWSEFNRMLEYKAEWNGVNILRIGRFSPSSKMCYCGEINKDLKLSDRVWECKKCNRVNQRDLLAANNIKKFALNKFHTGQELPEVPAETLTIVESMKQEAKTVENRNSISQARTNKMG